MVFQKGTSSLIESPAGEDLPRAEGTSQILNVLFDPRLGGPQLRAIQVAQKLRQAGVETRLVIPRGGTILEARLASENIAFDVLALGRPRQSLNPLLLVRYAALFWPNVFSIRALIRRHSIRVVHTNGLMHLQAAVAARLEKVGLVWHINDFVTPGAVTPGVLSLVRRWAGRVAVASRAVGKYYFADDDLEDRLRIVYAPVDIERFHPGVDGSAVRKEFGLSEDAPVIGTVGNLSPLKGIHVLIRALPTIRKQFPHLKVMVVGAKLENRHAYHRALIQLCRELDLMGCVIFTGQRNDIPELMSVMSVYVHPARTEACGMAVLEAAASGVPVVASAVGGVPETVLHNRSGILVPPDRPEEFSGAVIRLLESPETRVRMGQVGIEHCNSNFSLKCCFERHLELYRPFLQNKDSGVQGTHKNSW